MSDLGKRIITSLVLIAIVLNCLFIGNISWIVLLIIISLISWSEFFVLIKNIANNLWLKIGKTLPTYGLKLDDHTSFIKGGNMSTIGFYNLFNPVFS